MSIRMTAGGMCTIVFDNEKEKARAFYELIHSRAQFSGIGKNTLVVHKKDCVKLKGKNIKYQEIK